MRNHWSRVAGALLLSVSWLPPLLAQTAAPDWLDDPGNSKWILFGGQEAVAVRNGLDIHAGGGEGDIVPAEVAGVPCAKSLIGGEKPGRFYLKTTEPWDKFAAWLGADQEVQLTVRYVDAAKGVLLIPYDSSDARVKNPPYPDGVWKQPPEYPDGAPLAGSGTFKTLKVRLPFAYFAKRCHGADFRVDCLVPGFALAGVAVTRVPKGVAEAFLIRQELRVLRTTGMLPAGSGARFAGTFAQQTNEPLVMEAELAGDLNMVGGRSPGYEPAASGGGYIHFVAAAAWKFTLTTGGRYTMWERAAFPTPGGWNHAEQMDGLGETAVIDNVGPAHPAWKWVKSGSWDLKPGEHRFSLSYHAGARLDVLVLTPDGGKEPDLATLRSSYRGATSGEVWTAPVKPFDVAKWRSVQFTLSQGAAQVRGEASVDGGATWQAIQPQADLTTLAVKGNGADSLQFHLQFTVPENAAPPLFGGGQLVYQAGPANFKTVENKRLKIEIDPYGVRSIVGKSPDLPLFTAPPLHPSLIKLVYKKPGDAAPAASDLYSGTVEECTITEKAPDTPVMTLKHRLDNGMGLVTTITLLPSGQTEWQTTVDNPTGFEVAEIQFPLLSGGKIGATGTDDWFFMPRCWGQVWRNPGAGRGETFWGPSMRWCMLWDAAAGFYLGIEDARLDDYGFIYGADSSAGLSLGATQRILVRPQSRWTSAVCRSAVTGGDWHEGADIYRGYVAKTLQPCDRAPYITWLVDAWNGQQSGEMPTGGWDVIRRTRDSNEKLGIALMAANRQMLDGADSGYCGLYPFPCLAWGSLEEFQQNLAAVRASGGFYTPYHNYHLWSPSYGHYGRVGSFPKARLPDFAPKPDDDWYRRAAAHEYAGAYARFEAEYFAQLDMAMGSREWREWLKDWTRRYIAWGADGMYYDQFNMIYPNGRLYPDFDTYGCWTRGTLETISTQKRESRKTNPYYTSSGEVCNDVYGQFVDLHMTSGVFNRLDFFLYCNPNQLIIDGAWNGGLAPTYGGWERERFIWQVGARFEHVAGEPEWIRNVLALRRRVKSLLYAAEFRDTVGVTVTDGQGRPLAPEYTYAGTEDTAPQNAPYRGVICRWFRFRQGDQCGALLNIINAVSGTDPKTTAPRKDATVTMATREFGPVRAAWAFTLDGKMLPVVGKQAGDAYTFPVPPSELATVILVNRLPPLVEWGVDEVAATPESVRRLQVTLTSLNPDTLAGRVSFVLPKGWPEPEAFAFGPLASGAPLRFTSAITIPRKAVAGRQDIRCRIASDAGEFTTYSVLTVNPPVLAEFRGDPGSYHLWLKNLSAKPVKGTVAVTAPPPLRVAVEPRFDLPPEGELSLPVTITGTDRLHEISEMAAVIKVGKQDIRRVRGVMPVIPNGDFEADAAGDLKPDWWMCRSVRDEWSYDRIHLTPDAHGGKTALLLDPPQKQEKFIRAYPVNGMFKPGTRYKASIWIKARSATGVYAHLGLVVLGSGKTGPEWRQFTAEFTTPADRVVAGGSLMNESPEPASFDDLVVEELPPAPP